MIDLGLSDYDRTRERITKELIAKVDLKFYTAMGEEAYSAGVIKGSGRRRSIKRKKSRKSLKTRKSRGHKS